MADEPTTITPETVRQVAKLARLALDEQHVQKYASQLESILGYVDQIRRADVSGVEPMAHAVPLHNVLRDDVAAAGSAAGKGPPERPGHGRAVLQGAEGDRRGRGLGGVEDDKLTR